MVHKLAARDERVLYIGSDPGAGTLRAMSKEFPSRHLIEGISEAHIIGMSAGLAMEGYVPYVNTIATFLTRRCYEQVAVDLCLHNLPVRLIANGGGLVYAPLGPTHQAIEDIAIMRALPNMTVVCPARRRRDHAADGADARLARPDLYPPRQRRRCDRLQGRARIQDRQGDPDARARRRADGHHRHHAAAGAGRGRSAWRRRASAPASCTCTR